MEGNKKTLCIGLVACLAGFISCSRSLHRNNLHEQGFLNSPEAYLGQKPPADTPVVFAPGMLADSGAFPDDRIAISNDGKDIYYCTNTSWHSIARLQIKYFTYEGQKWAGPKVLNTGYNTPTFSPDGHTLYFGKKGAVWQSKRTDTGWSSPVPYIKLKYPLYDFMPTSGGTMYAGSRGTWENWQFSRLSASPGDTTAQSLGAPLNEPGFNGDFFIAKDESYMIISTKETKDFECELYISFRKADHTWGAPKSLGPLINNGPAHRWGEFVSPDGKYLFYSRGTSEKDCAIYWVRFDGLLKKLRSY